MTEHWVSRLAPAILLLSAIAMAGFVVELKLLEVPETESGGGQGGQGAGNGTARGATLVKTAGGGGGAGPATTGGDPGAAAGGGGDAKMNASAPEPPDYSRVHSPVDPGPAAAGRADSAAIDAGEGAGGGGQGGAGRKAPAAGGGGSGGDVGGTVIRVPEWAAWAIALLAGVLVAAGVGYLVKGRLRASAAARRRAAAKARAAKAATCAGDLQEELSEILDEVLLAFDGSTDARTAIVFCYTKMVSVLAARGVLRERSTTPGEFGRRWTALLGTTSEAMAGLTALFEEAVYSIHPMGERHRERARLHLEGALEEVRAWKPARVQ